MVYGHFVGGSRNIQGEVSPADSTRRGCAPGIEVGITEENSAVKLLRKWFRRILLGGVVLVLAGWLTGAWLLRHWTAKPPPLPADTALLRLKPETRDG